MAIDNACAAKVQRYFFMNMTDIKLYAPPLEQDGRRVQLKNPPRIPIQRLEDGSLTVDYAKGVDEFDEFLRRTKRAKSDDNPSKFSVSELRSILSEEHSINDTAKIRKKS